MRRVMRAAAAVLAMAVGGCGESGLQKHCRLRGATTQTIVLDGGAASVADCISACVAALPGTDIESCGLNDAGTNISCSTIEQCK